MEPASEKPIHIWDPRPRLLVALFVIGIPFIAFTIWEAVLVGPFTFPTNCHGRGCGPPVYHLFIALVISGSIVAEIIHARRLEFLESSVKVQTKGKERSVVIPYGAWQVGSLVRHWFGYYFAMFALDGQTPRTFHVKNSRLPEPKGDQNAETLYDWVTGTQAQRERLGPEVIRAEASLRIQRLLTPAALILAVALVAYTFVPGYSGLEPSDLWIAGSVLFVAIIILRGILNVRTTSH